MPLETFMRLWTLLFACLYAPLFWLGFLGAAVWLVEVRGLTLWSLLPLSLLAIVVSFLAEAVLPYDRNWNHGHGDRLRDWLHAFVNEALGLASLGGLPLLAALSPLQCLWPSHWPLVLQLLLALMLADAGITLVHWASHRARWLWKFHAVHHSVQRMYGFNGLMKHPLHAGIEAAGAFAPLLLLGIPLPVAALLAFAVAIQLLLQHSNVDIRPGPLRHVFVWAPLHRFHHLKYGEAGDVNFGLFFTLWDRLLGTFFDHRSYRVNGEDLGIGGLPDYPGAYLPQMLEPFRAGVALAEAPLPPEALRRHLAPEHAESTR
jgi:sterol desaturase/sphingolipid hydroxylase (fatty acid hydroxylase superfamily)